MPWQAEELTTTLRYGDRTRTVPQTANLTEEVVSFAREVGLKKGFLPSLPPYLCHLHNPSLCFSIKGRIFTFRTNTFSVEIDGEPIEPSEAPETCMGVREIVLIKHTEGGC